MRAFGLARTLTLLPSPSRERGFSGVIYSSASPVVRLRQQAIARESVSLSPLGERPRAARVRGPCELAEALFITLLSDSASRERRQAEDFAGVGDRLEVPVVGAVVGD